MGKRVRYSIPYNGDLELMKWAIESKQVYEVYFPGEVGRDYSSAYQNLRLPSGTEIEALIRLCAEQGIGRNLLLNKSILYFDNVKDIFSYIKHLDQHKAGRYRVL